MHRASHLLALGIIAAAAAACLGLAARPAGTATAAPAPDLAGVHAIRLQGSGSCAAAACHNADGPPGVATTEYSTWLAHDRHARAYSVLLDERSQRIMDNLYPPATPEQRRQPRHEALCLRCHSVDLAQVPLCESYQVADGVGCESCHGPAEQWKSTHYLPGFRQLSVDQKEALGFRELKDLTVRARVCTECHVGAGLRDVNHDLIAAGHPRLNFEMGLYTARMPKHWNMRDEKARYPDFEERVWLVGQVESARRALELLADRAEGSRDGRRPWPEFAEYTCVACHHNPRSRPEEEQERAGGGRVPGAFPWGTWYYAMTPVLAPRTGAPDWNNKETALGRLHALMSGPSPNPATVRDEARKASAELAGVSRALCEQRPDPGRVLGLLHAVVPPDRQHVPTNWDEAAQNYLAVAALYNALTDLEPRHRNPGLRQAIQALAGPLEPPSAFGTPENLTRFQNEMEAIRSRLPGR
jgi:hypothetical protein